MMQTGKDITIHIDKIILDGCDLPDYKKPRFIAEFQVELEHLFKQYGMPRERRLEQPVQWSSISEQTARRLARVVYRELGGRL